jgi:hypothetical protein
MTHATPKELDLLDALRGDPQHRPDVDRHVAATLRADIERALSDLEGHLDPERPLVIRPSSYRVKADVGPSILLRGLLITTLCQLLTLGITPVRVLEDGLNAVYVQHPDAQELVRQLDDDELARLRADVEGHFVTLRRALHQVPPSWGLRTGVRAYQRLGLGEVIARDTVDLMLGATTTSHASVALLDVTTGLLGATEERIARYHALVHTLRTGVAPLVTAVFSTATNSLWSHRVDDDLLRRAVAEFISVVKGRCS